MSTDSLELAAWRFIAAHRVGILRVSHATFIDGDKGCAINTPVDDCYESATAPTWGQAAIKLAITLGMPCMKQRHAKPDSGSDSVEDKSSASTATRRSGAKKRTSPRTRAGTEVSTTDATGADRGTAESVGPRSEEA